MATGKKSKKLQNSDTPVEPLLFCCNVNKPKHFEYFRLKSSIAEEEEAEEEEKEKEKEKEVYCKCRQPYIDDSRVMIECEQKGGCTHHKWYHLISLKLAAAPKGKKKWICPYCSLDNM